MQPAIVDSTDSTSDTHSAKSSDRASAYRQTTLAAVAIVGLALALCRVAAVDLAGIVTNDSLGYIRRADDPLGAGFVSQGYRQAAYPLFITISNIFGNLLGWDHILGVALLQRALLVGGLVLTVWAMRWWSVPIVAFATSASFVVHVDLILPEGILIPGCLIVGALLAAAILGRVQRPTVARVVFASACVLASLCASVKLQYAVLLAAPVAIGWLTVQDRRLTRRFAAVGLGSAVCFVVAVALAQSIENHAETGVFEPVSERARAEWYGAWTAVFTVHPENRTNPALATYFAEGDLYTFLHGIEQEVPEYRVRAAIIRDRIASMFGAAGTSANAERFQAFLGAVQGGRSDDLAGVVNRVLTADNGDTLTRVEFNTTYRAGGMEGIREALNRGRAPGIVTSGSLPDFSQGILDDHRPWRAEFGLASILLMLASLGFRGRHRCGIVAILVVATGTSAALALGYIDNARYLLGPLVISIIGATLALRVLVMSALARLGRLR